MSSRIRNQRLLRVALPASLVSFAFFTACVADEPGITDAEGGGSGAVSGTTAKAGSSNQSSAGMPSEVAEPTGAGMGQGGTGVEHVGPGTGVEMGGTPSDSGEAGQAGQAGQVGAQGGQGEGGAGASPIAMACLFHTDAPPATDGAGGAAPVSTVVLQTNAFVGSYLTDAAGRTLYTYGGDLPGDCQTPPKSQCTADCVVSWPPFDAGSRVLGAGLNDAAFGSIDRGDGTWQATYYGWPLYYYKTDLTLGQLTGQGKGKTWHVAELTPASVVILKVGAAKYLADAAGHTLYVSAADQAGSTTADPVSACDKTCLASFTPFSAKHLSVVTSLEESDFSVFVRHGSGGLQLAYKGMPLYSAKTDTKAAELTGLASTGFTAAVP